MELECPVRGVLNGFLALDYLSCVVGVQLYSTPNKGHLRGGELGG